MGRAEFFEKQQLMWDSDGDADLEWGRQHVVAVGVELEMERQTQTRRRLAYSHNTNQTRLNRIVQYIQDQTPAWRRRQQRRVDGDENHEQHFQLDFREGFYRHRVKLRDHPDFKQHFVIQKKLSDNVCSRLGRDTLHWNHEVH